MPSLAELQSAMARALLARDAAGRALPADWFDGDASRGLKVHRNTIVGACCAALRLSYPTLERVLGAPMFESLAAEYARAHPPQVPALDEYGAGFGAFAAAQAASVDAPLLHELAAYDWLRERVAQTAAEQYVARPGVPLDGGLMLQLDDSLRLLETHYALERMRAGEPSDTAPGLCRTLALWRRTAGVAVTELRPPAAAFVARLLQGAALPEALAAASACGQGDEAAVAGIIGTDVLQAGFARITTGDAEHGNRTEH